MKKLSIYIFLFLFFCNIAQTDSLFPECQGVDQKQWNKCQGTQKLSNERKYIGEFIDGRRHGQGTLINPDGSKYIGQWKEGLPDGKGIETWEDRTK